VSVLELGVKGLIAYLLGSISGSLLLGRRRGVDIRQLGSGNAGGTNALRTQGWRFALGVMAIDIGKALVAVGVLPGLDLPLIGIKPRIDREWLAVACAIAVVVGHVYPLWYEFRGGKGAATVWLVTVMLTGFVGLGTMLGSVALPVYFAFQRPIDVALLCFGVLMAAFVIYTHRANLARMRAGSESRARRLWLLRPR
jgi:glycerol-3-phosphate acyltransferase PlsY